MATQLENNHLLHLTRALCVRLPRELRNMIYDALLDDSTIIELLDVSRYPAGRNHFWFAPTQTTRMPNYLNPACVDTEVARELVNRFYTVCGIPSFSKPAPLKDFFGTDYFKLGVSPRDALLPGINLSVWIDLEDASKMEEQFRPLSDGKQKWAKGATVELHLNCFELFLSTEDAKRLVGPMLEALKPVVKDLEGRGGKVVTEMDVGLETGGDPPRENWKPRSEKLEEIEEGWRAKVESMP